MMRLILIIVFLVGASFAFGQGNRTEPFEIELGTYTGAGQIAGKPHTVNLKVTLGNMVLNYGGSVKCIILLRSTDTPNLYEEIDQYDSTGKIAKNSCQDKGFILFEKTKTGMIYHWGETAEVALEKPEPVALKKKAAGKK